MLFSDSKTLQHKVEVHKWTIISVTLYRIASERSDFFTAINVQAQTANIFSRLFAFGTARWPLET